MASILSDGLNWEDKLQVIYFSVLVSELVGEGRAKWLTAMILEKQWLGADCVLSCYVIPGQLLYLSKH